MKTTVVVTLLAGVVAIVGGFVAFRQHHELDLIKSRIAELRQSQAESAKASQKVATVSAPALSDAKKLELLKLRGEVTRLRDRQREFTGVEAENQRLRAKSGGGPAALPAGYLKRADAKYVGLATPEAAFQSFLWAIEREDTNALMQVLTEQGAVGFREALEAAGTEKFWKDVKMIPGFRLLGLHQREDGTMLLKFEMLPDDQPQEMTLRKIGTDWKLEP